MRIMKVSLARSIFWFLSLLLVSVSLFAEPMSISVTGITYPDSIAGLNRISYTDFEKKYPGKGLGYSFGYRTPDDVTPRITAKMDHVWPCALVPAAAATVAISGTIGV